MVTLLLLGCARSHPVADLPAVDALTGADVRWFELEGADRIELLESCLKDCPRDAQGVAVASLSTWQVRWSWTRGSSEPCEVTSAYVHATVVVELPRWEPPDGAAPALVAEWDTWHRALRGHEQGHVDVVRGFAASAEARLVDAGCAGIAAAGEDLIGRLRQAQLDYDAATASGHAQGAGFWSPRGSHFENRE